MTRKIRKIGKWVFYFLLFLIPGALIIVLTFRAVNKLLSWIRTGNGIQESFYIELGGIEQYIQIRGEDKSNPVIIFLHGGPGFPISYLSYYYQKDLVSDYTFVSWDQRGSGRTYYKNEGNQQGVTVQQLFSDLAELVCYVRARLRIEKVILIGQSWGSVLGSIYAKQHPENVSAYIGVGQAVDFDAGKILAAKAAIDVAEKLGKKQDVCVLRESIKVFSKSRKVSELDIDNFETMVFTSLKYLLAKGQISIPKEVWLGITSPDMSSGELRWFFNAADTYKSFKLEKMLVDFAYFEFDTKQLGSSFDVPVFFLQGESDWITPTSMVQDYYELITAPQKNIVIMKNTGHTPFLDDPAAFADGIKKLLSDIK